MEMLISWKIARLKIAERANSPTEKETPCGDAEKKIGRAECSRLMRNDSANEYECRIVELRVV